MNQSARAGAGTMALAAAAAIAAAAEEDDDRNDDPATAIIATEKTVIAHSRTSYED
ncbi:MAG: hypothetical protein VB023_08885 [Oscillibacter sp.]|nr:hypothetical protein [Oscillibacter sp.]